MFQKEERFESVLYPGAAIVYRTPSLGVLARIDMLNAEMMFSARRADLVIRGTKDDDPDVVDKRLRAQLDVDRAVLQSQINRVREIIVKVTAPDGQEIDGAQFVELAPLDLFREFLSATDKEFGLSEEERKNSQSPTTSEQPVDGATTITTAEPATTSATTPPVAA